MSRSALWMLMLCLLAAVAVQGADEGSWKTAYYKRGFVGSFDANWAGGAGATLRMRVPMPFAGTKVRLYGRGCFDVETALSKMALCKGVDGQGTIALPLYPVLFAGQPTATLQARLKEIVSDPLDVPITPGIWYVQDTYTSPKFPYAYDVDREFTEVGDCFEKASLAKTANCRLGIVYRIDVFTTDTRPTVLCYGDSITHGYASTPNGGCRYPDILATLLNRPTLNLGVNGDVITQTGGMPGMVGSLRGVDTVIFLMGINDIISNAAFTKEEYVKAAQRVISGCQQRKLKIYLGTILPAGGYKGFDAVPAKEALRTEINAWIRTASAADGVIDFDRALADPQNPTKIKAGYQCGDWLHPNDLGYKTMAETTANVLQPKP